MDSYWLRQGQGHSKTARLDHEARIFCMPYVEEYYWAKGDADKRHDILERFKAAFFARFPDWSPDCEYRQLPEDARKFWCNVRFARCQIRGFGLTRPGYAEGGLWLYL